MKSRIHRYLALAALLPALALAGCKESPNPNPTPPPDSGNPSVDESIKMLKEQKAVEKEVLNGTGGAPRLTPATAYINRLPLNPPAATGGEYLANWEAEIIQDSHYLTDMEVEAGYITLNYSLDTETDAQIAQRLITMTGDPRNFEIMLYRLSVQQHDVIWSKLTVTRVRSILTHLTLDQRETFAWYLGELSKLDLADETSVPWELI